MSKKDSKGFREVAGFLWLFAAILTLLSLRSYDAKDLGFSTSDVNQNISNFMGPVGAYWSTGLFLFFGMAAYFIPILFAFFSYTLFFDPAINWLQRALASIALTLSGAGLLHSQTFFGEAWRLRINTVSVGGFVGQWLIDSLMKPFVGGGGTVLILSAIFFTALAMEVDILKVAAFCWQTYLKGVEWWNQYQEKRLEKADPAEKLEIAQKRLEKQRRELEKKLSQKGAVPEELSPVEEKPARAVPPPKVIDAAAPAPKTKAEKALAKSPEKSKSATPVAAPSFENYTLPSIDLLQANQSDHKPINEDELHSNADLLVKTMAQFGIKVQKGDITRGATITRYEVYPDIGVRVDKIVALQRDLTRILKAEKINILAPIPGKDTVGIEVPNSKKAPIVLRDLFETEEWTQSRGKIPIAIGKDVYGKTLVTDLAEMPHLLIAGTTGSGKSVCINCLLLSLLYRFSPDELRLILVDPKQVEMQVYNSIPHLVVPVVTEPKKVLLALNWVINEMEKRYQILAKVGVRNIATFNSRAKTKPKVEELDLPEKMAEDDSNTAAVEITPPGGKTDDDIVVPDRLPYIVVIIDELADLMQTAPADVESAIARLSAKARAAGIHLVVATQTPRREVVTGVIKTNIPSRIAFQVPSALDSRVILDENGAENLLGKGDLLYLPPGSAKLVRGQGAFVSDEEVRQIVEFASSQSQPSYEQEIHKTLSRPVSEGDSISAEDEELIQKCIEVLRQEKRASTSLLQRRLRLGYNRAAWVIDILEQRGIVGPENGAKPREILVDLDRL